MSSKVTGKLVEVAVEEGMAVREGQILARLDDSTIRAQLALAQARLAASERGFAEQEVRQREAELTLGRTRRLVDEGVIGRAEIEGAEAEVDSLVARIALARGQVIGDLVRRGGAATGVSAGQYVSVDRGAIGFRRHVSVVQGQPDHRPSAGRTSRARNRLLPLAVGANSRHHHRHWECHRGADGDRRGVRRGEHDVQRGGHANARDRHAARAWVSR